MKLMRKLAMILLAAVLAVCTAGLIACTPKDPTPTGGVAPTLTLSEEIPTGGLVGRDVVLPVATAKDGDTDISDRAKVTVERLKADGTVDKQILFRAAANVAQTFVPTGNTLLSYRIKFFVSNDANKTTEQTADFTAVADTELPVLSLEKSGDFSGFDEDTGITGVKPTQDISLPKARGVKPADNFDVSNLIEGRIYLASDSSFETSVMSFDPTRVSKIRIIQGSYVVRYTLTDAAGNTAEPATFPLAVDAPDLGTNLILDRGNISLGFDSRYNDVLRQIEVGRTSYGSQADDCASAVVGVKKLHNDTVGITLNIDPYVAGGEALYDIAFVGSKNGSAYWPDGSEGQWAPYIVVRILSGGGMSIRGTSAGSGSEALDVVGFTGNLRDGNDHTVFVRNTFGDSIVTEVWVDVLPGQETVTGGSSANYYKAQLSRGEGNARGELQAEVYDKLVDAASGAGWLTFGSATFDKTTEGKYADDIMRIKGVAYYPNQEAEFGVDIKRPVLSTTGTMPSRGFIGEEVTIPEFAGGETDGNAIEYNVYRFDMATFQYLLDEENKVVVANRKFTPAAAGYYAIVVSVTDNAGNKGYRQYFYLATVVDDEAPAIDLDTTDIEAKLGDAFDLPKVSANDNVDGDLSSEILLTVNGPYYQSGIRIYNVEKFSLQAPGEYEFTYSVTDLAGNRAEKTIKVTITNPGEDPAKNIVAEEKDYDETDGLAVTQGSLYEYQGRYVYDEKVTMVMNVEYYQGSSNQLFQINLRGSYADGNKDWPTGMVMRVGTTFDISLSKHDEYIVGTTSNPFNQVFWRGQDVVFQYQVDSVRLADGEYLRVRAWINGKPVQYSAARGATVVTYADADVAKIEGSEARGAIAVPAKWFTDGTMPTINRSAGPVRFVSYSGFIANIKELYIGKEISSFPEDPQPFPITAPDKVTAAPAVNTAEQTVANAIKTGKTVANGAQGEYRVTFSLKKTGGEISLVLTGGTEGDWSNGGGLSLHYRNDYGGFYLGTNGGRFDANAATDLFFNTGALTDGQEYILAVKLSYLYTNAEKTLVKGINVQMWMGASADSMTEIGKTLNGSAVTEENGWVDVRAMTTAAITTNGIWICPSPAGDNTMTVKGISAE